MNPNFLAAIGAALCFLLSASAFAQTGDGAKKHPDDISKKIQAGSFTPRIFVRNEYRSNQDGSYVNVLVPLVEVPVGETMAFRAEIPLVTRNPRKPGTDADTGLGDITLRLSRTTLTGEGYAMVLGVEYNADSATEDSLDSGQHTLSPLVFGSVRLPRLNSILFPLIQYYETVAGDDSRPDVHYTNIKTMVLTRLPDSYYTFVEPAIYIDHERNDRVGMNLEIEFGRFVDSQTMIYGRPGAGLFGDNLPQVFNWNFEVGFRHFFK